MRGRETREINDLQPPGLGVYAGKVHLLGSLSEVARNEMLADQRKHSDSNIYKRGHSMILGFGSFVLSWTCQ